MFVTIVITNGIPIFVKKMGDFQEAVDEADKEVVDGVGYVCEFEDSGEAQIVYQGFLYLSLPVVQANPYYALAWVEGQQFVKHWLEKQSVLLN